MCTPRAPGDDQERDAAAADVGQAAARPVVVALVPDDEDRAAVSVGARAHDAPHPARQEPVAGAHGPVVHVVGIVGHDVAQGGGMPQAARQRLEALEVAALAVARRDASEVHERVVVADVLAPVAADVAAVGEALDEPAPAEPAGGELGRDRWPAEPAPAPVARAAVRGAGDHRQVVRKAWVARRVEPGRDPVAARHPVQERRFPVSEDLPQAVVLHDEDPCVVHPVRPGLRRCGCREDEQRRQTGCEAREGSWASAHRGTVAARHEGCLRIS